MSKNINQIFIANPITSNASTDLMYFGQSPYGVGNDAAMTYSNFSAQFTLKTLTNTHIFVGNGSNIATDVAMSGDATLANTGALTLANTAVTAATYTVNGSNIFTVDAKGRLTSATSITVTAVPSGSAGGDLSGSYPNPAVAKINGVALGSTTATAGNLLIGSGTQWVTNAMSGDATLTSAGAITVSKIGGISISLAGSFTTSGAFAVTQTYTGITNVTFPTSGTLATTGQLPTPAALTQANDTNVTLTLGGTPATALLQATSITAGWTGTLSGTRGGTGVNNGASTITIGGNVTYSGAFTFTGTLTNTTAVTFPTSGTLATTSQFNFITWNDVSGTSQAAVANNGYIISNAAQTTVTLPATAAEGIVFAVQGKGAAGFILQANTGQIIHLGSSATSSAGSLTSTNLWDSVSIVCVTANTTFAVTSVIGNLTVA